MKQEERIQKFMQAYGELVKKYEVDILAIPQYLPDEKGGWQLKIQSQPVDLVEMKKAQGDNNFVAT